MLMMVVVVGRGNHKYTPGSLYRHDDDRKTTSMLDGGGGGGGGGCKP